MWRLRVDTGGTFTDGLARDPAGRLQRVKILSSGALRGRIVSVDAGRRLQVQIDWRAPAGLVETLAFRRIGSPEIESRVAGFDIVSSSAASGASSSASSSASGTLELREPPADLVSGQGFELLSTEEAPVLAARLLTGTAPGTAFPPTTMRLATTLGTNALLQRKGVATALFITAGFGDLPTIGDQQRPDLFALRIDRPAPLQAAVVEVDERLAADGSVIRPLDIAAIEPVARQLLADGVRSAAVALLHAYRNPEHEQRLAARLHELGFEHVSGSAELSPTIKLFPRSQTAVVDAYLAPVVRTYLERVRKGLAQQERGGDLLVMTSAGGLVAPEGFRPKDSLLSGPAGGVVGAAAAGRRSGCQRIIGLDMGGTSTDVARFDGDYEYRYEHRVGDARLVAPALAIETVAAGGGSICWLDGERLRVGPQSAGADPGPACYGAGGPLTVTDVNVLLGRIDPQRFGIPIDPEPARADSTSCSTTSSGAAASDPTEEAILGGLLDHRQRDDGRRDPHASRCAAATTRPSTPWSPSAAPAASMPVASPRRLGIDG